MSTWQNEIKVQYLYNILLQNLSSIKNASKFKTDHKWYMAKQSGSNEVVLIAMFLVPKVLFRTNKFIPPFYCFLFLMSWLLKKRTFLWAETLFSSLSLQNICGKAAKKKVKSERQNFKLTARLKLLKMHADVDGVWTDRVRWSEYAHVYENGMKTKLSRVYEKAPRKKEISQFRLLWKYFL